MSRYIDADAIKGKAWKAENEACFYALEDVVSVTDIDEAPSIDIEPKRGEWIDKGKNLWECSNCEMVIYSESEQDRNEFHKWCSRCGSRMKGADDE